MTNLQRRLFHVALVLLTVAILYYLYGLMRLQEAEQPRKWKRRQESTEVNFQRRSCDVQVLYPKIMTKFGKLDSASLGKKQELENKLGFIALMKDLPNPEVDDFPDLPAGFLTPLVSGLSSPNSYLTYKLVSWPAADGKCTLKITSERKWIQLKIGVKDWALLTRVIGKAIWRLGSDGRSPNYKGRAHFVSKLFLSGFMGVDRYEEKLYQYLREEVQDEVAIKSVAGELLLYSEKLFEPATLRYIKAWLPHFYEATYADFPKLEAKVRQYDAQRNKKCQNEGKEGEECNYDSYFKVKSLKPQGWFLRRWIKAGRGQKGQDMIVVYRFWLTRLGRDLEIAEAKRDWAPQVRRQLRQARKLKLKPKWYLRQLR